jgi:SAM-dependent methyltransferase
MGLRMAESHSHEGPCSQEKIWTHFQNNVPESFDAARPRLDFLVGQIRKLCPTERPVVLNIGVGSGYFERQAARQPWEVHSLDPDEQALAKLEAQNVHCHVGLIEKIPMPNESCHCVVASEVIEHLTEEQGKLALAEVARVLKPGGLFLGTVPYCEDLAAGQVVCPRCGELFHRWGHHRSFILESLRQDLAEHFQVKAICRTAFPPFRGCSLSRKAKSLVRVVLARCGQMIAIPSLYWHAMKK